MSFAGNYISGICQHQTQFKAWKRKCIGILQCDDLKHPYRQCVPLHECNHALQRQRHVASSCTQGNRSAALVVPLFKTTCSCLVDTTSPWSVQIRVRLATSRPHEFQGRICCFGREAADRATKSREVIN